MCVNIHLFFVAICPPNGCHNGGSCISPGVCRCANGWSGNNCETRMHNIVCIAIAFVKMLFVTYKAVCPGGCFNGGVCTAPGTCTCTSGWTGNDCRQGKDMSSSYL